MFTFRDKSFAKWLS